MQLDDSVELRGCHHYLWVIDLHRILLKHTLCFVLSGATAVHAEIVRIIDC